ncbi:LAME_0C06260g1_1 [Lachancea meyersii CBS 8951]|uniref:LAME_0C06260g1_1 n=1 Tax=Lachancea meyersii CBS 8951 TaxID=1266667 RepID=A0A1G4J2A7_9SACH|nr:LAME_0C06260g1_1 [Lachancea meyersii CBS 8951]
MSNDPFVDYSQLLAHLLTEQGELNDGVVSFLYHLFPGELFVRAMSLLDSRDMFIYMFERPHTSCRHSESTVTEPDQTTEMITVHSKRGQAPKKRPNESSEDLNSKVMISHSQTTTAQAREAEEELYRDKKDNSITPKTTNLLCDQSNAAISAQQEPATSRKRDPIKALYDIPQTVVSRLVVKQDTPQSLPICVDLDRWFCSCDEYNAQFLENILQNADPDAQEHIPLYSRAIQELNPTTTPLRSDRFARLPTLNNKFQRYFRHELAMCPHLLAFAILLQTSPRTLAYFTQINASVYLITVQNLDEWLNLHLNVVH